MNEKNYGLVESEEQLVKLVDKLLAENITIAIDIESGYDGPDRFEASLHPEDGFVVGISFTNSTNWARYVPLKHNNGDNFDCVFAAQQFWRLLQSGQAIAHNFRFDARMLSKFFLKYLSDDSDYGKEVIEANGYFPFKACTLLEAYIAAERRLIGLKSLTKENFGHVQTEIEELFPELTQDQLKCLRYNTLELTPAVINYVCEDVVWCLKLHERYYDKVKNQFIYKVEINDIPVVAAMEDYGIKYDWEFMREAADKAEAFKKRMNEEIQEDLSELCGVPVDVKLSSYQQLQKTLYGILGMRPNIYTDSARKKVAKKEITKSEMYNGIQYMATGATALKKLAPEYPVVKRIREWKGINKLLGSYLNKYERMYSYAEDGMVHPSHKQAGTVTGRFAVKDPNYQQMPKVYRYLLRNATRIVNEHKEVHADTVWAAKHPETKFDDKKCLKENNCTEFEIPEGEEFFLNFRDAIIAPDDHYIIGYDLSMAELRVMTGEAQEPTLLKAFLNHEDVHVTTASLMLGIPRHEVTKEQRDKVGKQINFSLLFLMAAKTLSDRLGIPIEEAELYHNQFFQNYSAIKVYTDKQIKLGKNKGYALSKWGRKMPIWSYGSDKRWIREKGDRDAVNYPVQSAVADFMKVAMYRIDRSLKEKGLIDKVHMVMNVHDALYFYAHQSVSPQQVYDSLKDVITPSVEGWPEMIADWSFGYKWGSMVDIEFDKDGKLKRTERDKDKVIVPDEESEEDDEDTGIDDSIDLSLLRETILSKKSDTTQNDYNSEEKHVIIQMTDMPTEQAYAKFLTLMLAKPGSNVVHLRTPEGELELEAPSGITPKDQAQVSMALNGASVTYAPESVDAAEILSGIEF